MSGRLPDDQRADAVLTVDQDGHLTVTLDGRPWTPPSSQDDGVPLGRSDLRWVLQQLAAQRDAPLWLLLHDAGRSSKGVIVPKHLKNDDPLLVDAPASGVQLHQPPAGGPREVTPPVAIGEDTQQNVFDRHRQAPRPVLDMPERRVGLRTVPGGRLDPGLGAS